MSLGYTISAMIFAALCSVIWLILGHSLVSALSMYLFSGQLAMFALIGRAALRFHRVLSLQH